MWQMMVWRRVILLLLLLAIDGFTVDRAIPLGQPSAGRSLAVFRPRMYSGGGGSRLLGAKFGPLGRLQCERLGLSGAERRWWGSWGCRWGGSGKRLVVRMNSLRLKWRKVNIRYIQKVIFNSGKREGELLLRFIPHNISASLYYIVPYMQSLSKQSTKSFKLLDTTTTRANVLSFKLSRVVYRLNKATYFINGTINK